MEQVFERFTIANEVMDMASEQRDTVAQLDERIIPRKLYLQLAPSLASESSLEQDELVVPSLLRLTVNPILS